jgi:hypothetical protein
MEKHKQLWMATSLISITLVNIIQAVSLELYADEAYYVLYSRFPDWGYFDHPPAVGILIYLGKLISASELGVRLPFILLSTASYYLLYDWIKPKHYQTFWLVVLALFPIHLMGFMALPDIPVFFFAILFFRTFQGYIQKESIANILLLAISITGMLYSKYHGVLIILFSFFTVPSFFLKRSFYILTVISLLIYLPHFLWLYQHEFSTIKYHFLERSSSSFKIKNSLEYLAGFIFFNGPLVFALMIWASFSNKTKDAFDSVLKINVIGFFVFFLISSLKGRVEANWTFLLIIPVLYLTFNTSLKFEKTLKVASIISILLILVFRVHLINPLITLKRDRANEFHGHKQFVSDMIANSNGKPIVANRYQEASLLSFYSEKLVPSINMNSRKNQFDFWTWVDDFENKDVLMLKRGEAPTGVKSFKHPYFGQYYLEEIKQLPILRYPEISISNIHQTTTDLTFEYSLTTQNQINTARLVSAKISIYNEQSRTDTLLQLANETLNQQKLLKQKLAWSHQLPARYLEISILSDSLGVWKHHKIQLD